MRALSTAISTLCQTMALDREEIQLWLDQHLGVAVYPQVQLLRLANKYQLDPLADEITLIQDQDQTYQPFITIDGWSKLINHHPQYAGMSLRDSTELIEGIPTWIECTIYRSDRILPIVIKEYFEEVKTDHASWQQMPRRMLRHRAIQQCARLALGISVNEQFTRTKSPFPNPSNEIQLNDIRTEETKLHDENTPSRKSRANELKTMMLTNTSL